jgi:hypothetical protein
LLFFLSNQLFGCPSLKWICLPWGLEISTSGEIVHDPTRLVSPPPDIPNPVPPRIHSRFACLVLEAGR